MSEFHYVGTELDVFAYALNWKSYVHKKLHKYLVGDVLEVGAGIGAATQILNNGTQTRWVCLEPDSTLAEKIKPSLPSTIKNCEVRIGALAQLDSREHFDAILYMDVLEHIEDDRAELLRAVNHLKPNGCLSVLSPAFPWLYTPFDAAIGHFRRYTKASIRAIAPAGLKEEELQYLDSVGMLASAGNRLFLRSASPTFNQIRLWDHTLVPVSTLFDPLVGFAFGRSILAVWRANPRTNA